MYRRLSWVGALALAAAPLSVASPASACDIKNHCYASTQTTARGLTAIGAVLNPTCLGTTSGNFITSEVWLVGDNGTWVEVGYIRTKVAINGLPLVSGGVTYGFWGDKRPGSTFYGHPLVTNPALSKRRVAIAQITPSSFQSNFGGNVGYSMSNSMDPGAGQIGSETTTNKGAAAGVGSRTVGKKFEYALNRGAWHVGLISPTTPNPPSPLMFNWQNKPKAANFGVRCDTMAMRPPSPPLEQAPEATAQDAAWALNPYISLEKAAKVQRVDDHWPSNVNSVIVASLSRDEALKAMEAPASLSGPEGKKRVLLYQMRGQFSLRLYPHPPTASGAPVVGDTYQMLVNPDTGEVLDGGVTNRNPNQLPAPTTQVFNRNASRALLTEKRNGDLQVSVAKASDRGGLVQRYDSRDGLWLTTKTHGDLSSPIDVSQPGKYRVVVKPHHGLGGWITNPVRIDP
ncbi:MAG: hypothetical protein U0904_09160 [Candidatus Nanopelagicales bacterium]|nr:hypothetical protein [Candidatus Nanopelagicales bacterium]